MEKKSLTNKSSEMHLFLPTLKEMNTFEMEATLSYTLYQMRSTLSKKKKILFYREQILILREEPFSEGVWFMGMQTEVCPINM